MDKKCNGSSVIYDKKNFRFCNMLSCYLVLWPGSCSKPSCFKQSWSCPLLENLCPLNVKKRAVGLLWLWNRNNCSFSSPLPPVFYWTKHPSQQNRKYWYFFVKSKTLVFGDPLNSATIITLILILQALYWLCSRYQKIQCAFILGFINVAFYKFIVS